MKKLLFLVLVFVAFLGNAQTSDLWKDAKKENVEAVVMSCHDADGCRIKKNGVYVSLRLIGVDAPEIRSNLITNSQEYGIEAGNKLRATIKGKSLVFQLRGKDKYGRTLANAAMSDGSDLGLWLIENGLAWYVPSRNLTKRQRVAYIQAMEYAQSEKIGLWAFENPVLPSVFRKKNMIKKKVLGIF